MLNQMMLEGRTQMADKKHPEIFSEEVFDRETDEYIKEGLPFPELLINTTYFFDKWISATLPFLFDDTKFLRDVVMSEEQRLYFYLGCIAPIMEKDAVCRLLFSVIRDAYRVKSFVNRLSEAELMDECRKLAKSFSVIAERFSKMAAEPEDGEEFAYIVERLKEEISISYPPTTDAEAVEFVRGYFLMAMCICCGCIRGVIEGEA